MIKLPQSFPASNNRLFSVVNKQVLRANHVLKNITHYPFLILIVSSCLLNGLIWLLSLQFFPRSNPLTVLHYTTGMGIDFIGEGSHIIVLPTIGLIVILANSILGWAIVKADKRASWVMWSMILPVQLILLSSFYLIWQANG